MAPVCGFVRGVLPALEGWAGSRYPDAVLKALPRDSVEAARVPASVHLALEGTASSVRLDFTRGDPLAYAAPTTEAEFFAVAGQDVVRTPVPESGGSVEIALPAREAGESVRVYLPERSDLRLQALTPLDGEIGPVSTRRPLWVAYGDSITQGWSVEGAESSWVRRIAGRFGLELVNLGLAGSARGEQPAAVAVSESGAEIVTVSWGTNAWSTVPTDPDQIRHTMRVFLATVRQGLPTAPVIVASPVVRPQAEDAPNRYGATLKDLRTAMEDAVEEFVSMHSDKGVTLVRGLELVGAAELVDGIHPGDVGHGTMADRLAPFIESALASLATTASE